MDKQDKEATNANQSNIDDVQQPGPSQPKPTTEPKQTLADYLAENMEALKNEEMFAVVPLKYCPHLPTLDPNSAPERKLNIVSNFPTSRESLNSLIFRISGLFYALKHEILF